jgi:NTE family protein
MKHATYAKVNPVSSPDDSNISPQLKQFTEHPRVLQCIARLETKFDAEHPLVVSDVIDDAGNQYVHLVQKGGGVLGVALVGYTYILELMGIRFLKQAGTSAGAINTALMTVIKSKQDVKSLDILQVVCDLDFFALVDGHPFAKEMIKQLITDGDYTKKLKRTFTIYFASLAFLFVADILLLGLLQKFPALLFWTGLSFMLTGITVLIAALAISYGSILLKRLKNAGYGINPGDYFYDWIKNQFELNEVKTVHDLNAKAAAKIPGLRVRYDNHPRGMEGLEGSVTFIASELTSMNKIQLPQMCDLFSPSSKLDQLHPAGFVRASMSIPIFFESYVIDNIDVEHDEIKQAWEKRFGEGKPPHCARFVDGGMLSNFPLDLFYNPGVEVPRLPVFGIDLDSSVENSNSRSALEWSLMGYFGRMFSTLQNNSDKEFLLKNKVYKQGVGSIKVGNFNWLNFFLPPAKKVELFILGVEAATEFLLKFDWEKYKAERSQMQTTLNN